jgi:hypothetical protein
MKTILSILSSLILLNTAQAQYSENFEQGLTALTGNCWEITGINYTTTPTDVITGTGSGYTSPPTGSADRVISTPFLNIGSSLTFSFKYKVSSKISGNATRTIEIGLLDKNDIFTSLQTITLDKNTATTVFTHSATYSISSTGVYRLSMKIGGSSGDGNSRVIFDDFSTNASLHYATTSCNPAATAIDDSYSSNTISNVSGTVLANDNIPADSETYTTSLVTAPLQGTLVLNPNGSFTYTPVSGFTGGTITFTYQVADNGYTPATSNIATVSINYASPSILPIRLVSFNAAVEGSIVKILWKAAENETGGYFELEKSADGKAFVSIQKVSVKDGVSVMEYMTTDNKSNADVYYRLKIVNKDVSVSYSKVVVIRAEGANAGVQILNNPAMATLNIRFASADATQTTIKVFSMSGVKVSEQKLVATKGINNASIELQNLQAGAYVAVLETGTNKAAAQFVKK